MTRSLILIIALTLSACATPPTPQPTAAAPAATAPASTVTPTQKVAPTSAAAPRASTPSSQLNSAGNVPSVVPSCPTDVSTPLFNTSPIDINDFIAFRPLGFLSHPIHVFPAKHSAFSMTLPGQKAVAKPVKAPGKVWVVEIWEATFSTGGANYQVFVYPCREVRVYFGHVATLSEKMIAEFKKGEPKCNSFADGTATVTTCRRENMTLTLEAGEPFGAGPDSAGVDFGVIDVRRKPAGFIVPEHYDSFYPYYASPLDYFTPEVKKVLESKTGNVFGTKMRTADPIGGTYMQDVAGTAQGNWFPPGKYHRNSTDLSPMMSLVHDYTDPTQPILSVGTSVQGTKAGLYSFKIEKEGVINRDFNEVKADGKTYCYENFASGQSAGGVPLNTTQGVFLVTLPSATTLKMEFVAGASCKAASALTANAAVFER